MPLSLSRLIFTAFFILFSVFASLVYGYELKTSYATILYDSEDQLKKFNKEVALGSLSYLMRGRKNITIEDETKNKVDVIVERVENILEMFTKDLAFKIVLLSSDNEVQKIYRNKYGKSVDYIAFYSPRDKTVFISVRDVNLRVFAHEIAHVIVDHYYGIPTPSKIHEVLAHYVETHLME